MNVRKASFIVISALLTLAGSAINGQCATPSTADKDISLLESRFFSRQYANDPLEKRVERLELLVFAATQDGTVEERLARIKKVLAQRAAESHKTAATQPPSEPGASKPAAKPPSSSSQYPVLNTLEWRALQKTYPSETLDQRLARMEKKLFGQEAQSMAYVDRIERLKRTLGIGMTAMSPQSGPLGPGPKARPRSQSQDLFGWSTPQMEDQMPMMPNIIAPPGVAGQDLMSTFNRLFADMNRQMEQFDRMAPGMPMRPGPRSQTFMKQWTWDPSTGGWTEQNLDDRKQAPGQNGPGESPSPLRMKPTQPDVELPPYTDPNSI